MGYATTKDSFIQIPRHTAALLEQREVERVGRQMAAERSLVFTPSKVGEYVSGRLTSAASLISERFAMIENGLGFSSCLGSPSCKIASANTSPASSVTTVVSNGDLAGSASSGCEESKPA
jgi:hypothetical protein